jgi:hypothetical protein
MVLKNRQRKMVQADISRDENDAEKSLKTLRNFAANLALRLDSSLLARKLLAHLSLAQLAICPLAMDREGGSGSTIIKALAEHLGHSAASISEDASSFADLTEPFSIKAHEGSPRQLVDAVLECAAASGNGDARACLSLTADPLAIGWAYEWLQLGVLKESKETKDTKGNKGTIESGHRTKLENKELQSTQIFTPKPIAEYLAQTLSPAFASLPPQAQAILDPACGAGHLLLPAADVWLGSQNFAQSQPARQVELLKQLLEQVLWGLERDKELVEITGFALYLFCRKIGGSFNLAADLNLPIPQIYYLTATTGSLALGLEPIAAEDLRGQKNLSDFIPREFAAVVMNPPYLSTRTMDDTTAAFLRRHYTQGSGDLYTAFIELAVRLLAPGGRLATIVQKSFLFIQRYRKFRLSLLETCKLKALVDLGPGAFSSRPGEKVSSAILIFEKKNAPIADEQPTAPQDHIEYGRTLNRHHLQKIDQALALQTIRNISGNPFALDCPSALGRLFKGLPALADCSDIAAVNGLFTCDNKLFVKKRSALTDAEAKHYVPYDKGGGKKWYHDTELCLRWLNDGDEIRDFRQARGQSRALPGEEYYFQPGLTYSYIGTKGFKARLLSPDSIFDIASSAVFTTKADLNYLLALFNSSLYIYLLSVLNPTINFQIGDIRRLPYKEPNGAEAELAKLAAQAIVITKQARAENDPGASAEAKQAEATVQEAIDELVFDLYEVDQSLRHAIAQNTWVQASRRNSLA